MPNPTEKRFLVVQLGDIGDLILTTPAISALRDTYPNAHIALLTSKHASKIFTDNDDAPLLDEIVIFDRQGFNSSRSFLKPDNLRTIWGLRKGQYNTVIFCHHFTLGLGTLKFAWIALASGAKQRIGLQNGNGWFLTDSIPDLGFGESHQAQYWLDLVSLLDVDSTPRQTIMSIDTSIDIPQHDGIRAVIHTGSGGYSLARRWDIQNFAQVADRLHADYDAQVILVGSDNDDVDKVIAKTQAPVINLSNKTTLPQLAGLIQQADVYIGADSGVMHVASTTNTPIVSLFGPSNHEAWSAWTPNSQSIILRSDVECSPCSYVEHGIGLRDGCPARTCMRLITVERVMNAVNHILNSASLSIQLQPPAYRHHSRIHILGLPVDAITYDEWLDLIDTWVTDKKRAHHVCTTNPEFMMMAQKDPNFRNILKRADLSVPDGVGLLWAAKRQGNPLPQRVTGSDGVPIIAERASQKGWRLFLLGAGDGIAEQTAEILQLRYPNLIIAGTYAGSPKPEDEDHITQMVNTSNAHILFVAYGAPEQDKWIARNLPRLEISMAMGVGGAFDFITGVVPRAPMSMRNLGLEWLYRLYKQPWRIKRMIRLPRFVVAVLRQGGR